MENFLKFESDIISWMSSGPLSRFSQKGYLRVKVEAVYGYAQK